MRMKFFLWAVAVSLASVLAAAVAAADAAPFAIPLSSCEVVSGQPEIAGDPGAPLAVRIGERESAQVAFEPFAVEPDTIYRITLRMRRTPRADLRFTIQEVSDDGVGAVHGLAFRPGYAPVPGSLDDCESTFATTAAATGKARLSVELTGGPHPADELGGVSIASAQVVKAGKVIYPPTDSANFAPNPGLTKADENGVATGFQRWAGVHDAKVVNSVGPQGGAALEIKQRYLLVCDDIAVIPGHPYRISAAFKGAGNVGFELRGMTASHAVFMMGAQSRRHDVSPDEWRRFAHETVALPGQARLIPVVSLQPAAGHAILMSDIEVVQVGRQKQGVSP